jgi:hypothetical protein
MSEYTPINDPDFEKMLLDAAVDMFQEKNRFPVPKAGNQGAGNQGSPAPPPFSDFLIINDNINNDIIMQLLSIYTEIYTF